MQGSCLAAAMTGYSTRTRAPPVPTGHVLRSPTPHAFESSPFVRPNPATGAHGSPDRGCRSDSHSTQRGSQVRLIVAGSSTSSSVPAGQLGNDSQPPCPHHGTS